MSRKCMFRYRYPKMRATAHGYMVCSDTLHKTTAPSYISCAQHAPCLASLKSWAVSDFLSKAIARLLPSPCNYSLHTSRWNCVQTSFPAPTCLPVALSLTISYLVRGCAPVVLPARFYIAVFVHFLGDRISAFFLGRVQTPARRI